MSSAPVDVTTTDDEISAQLEDVAALPLELTASTEDQLLRTVADKLLQVFPDLGFLRIQLVWRNYQPGDAVQWAASHQAAAALAALADSDATSQQAAMRRGVSLHTQHLQGTTTTFADWQLLHQQFGLQSFAAVPLVVAGTVHGVILAASPQPSRFNARSLQVVEAAAHALAPYAALLVKRQQIHTTRLLMEQVLPPRVVDAAIERVAAGGMSAADLFVPSHDPQPPV